MKFIKHIIQIYILKHVSKHPRDIVKNAIAHFDTSRTTVVRHINYLIQQGKLLKSGTTKQTRYMLPNAASKVFYFTLDKDFDEFACFTRLLKTTFADTLNQNAYDICEYGVTEMLNNCKDHAKSKQAMLSYRISKDTIKITIL